MRMGTIRGWVGAGRLSCWLGENVGVSPLRRQRRSPSVEMTCFQGGLREKQIPPLRCGMEMQKGGGVTGKAAGLFVALALCGLGTACLAQASATDVSSPAALPATPPKVTEFFPL